ncbi:hypothetical protein [Streptomyces sp. NPDC088847]|uniref:hypothetical protein n=1 Tax=Streptomyces sp. NPDC088847 TaxID=3365909 RepID=UPI00382621EF
MAKTPVVVTEDDYKADQENVQRIETAIPGFPDADPIVTYVKVQHVDDLTSKPATDGIECVPLLVPVEKTREEIVIGEDGEPEKNADGSEKLVAVKYWDYEPMEIDLSPASLKKLITALKPFAEKCRTRVVSVPSRTVAAKKSDGPDPALTEWNRRVKMWLEKNRPEYGVLANTRGRIKAEYETLYVQQNPSDPKPV